MSLAFIAGAAVGFMVLILVAERWSIIVAGALLVLLAALL